MGVFSNDMIQLCGEIGALRKMRGALLKHLEHETIDRKVFVLAMRAAFSNAQAEMARQTRADRQAFLFSLKRVVAGKRRELRADLMGARQAWFGKGARGVSR